jgi:hypothetical protein
MKNYVIKNGAFTVAGNYTGYTSLGERVHLYKRQMEGLGFTTNEEVKLPLFVIGDVKEFNKLDANGQPTDEVVHRLTGLSVFKNESEITQAYAESVLLDAKINQGIRTQATSAGLTEDMVQALLAVSL